MCNGKRNILHWHSHVTDYIEIDDYHRNMLVIGLITICLKEKWHKIFGKQMHAH